MATASHESETRSSAEGIPKEFRQIARDFLRDFFTTFPEYRDNVDQFVLAVAETESAPLDDLFAHVKSVFPQRFDILYKNEEMFQTRKKIQNFYQVLILQRFGRWMTFQIQPVKHCGSTCS